MRLIDADALIEQMEADAEQMEELLAKMFAYAAINDVKHSPTVQPKPRWIPCSERFPEDGADILVTYVDEEETRVIPVNYGRGTWFDGIFDRALDSLKITAWMPLPKPYDEDKQND